MTYIYSGQVVLLSSDCFYKEIKRGHPASCIHVKRTLFNYIQ